MIEKRTCLAVIVARGGSKGLPGKNLAHLGGKPLVTWSITAANSAKYLDRIILSSDDEAIITVAQGVGCEVPFRRPQELASDEASVIDTLIHALGAINETYDYLVLLQATSPLRSAQDIDRCIEMCNRGAPAVVSVTLAEKPPEWMCTLDGDNRLIPAMVGAGLHTRRQDLTKAFVPNGAVYAVHTQWFLKHKTFYCDDTVGYVMPKERSIDIDDGFDLMEANLLLQSRINECG